MLRKRKRAIEKKRENFPFLPLFLTCTTSSTRSLQRCGLEIRGGWCAGSAEEDDDAGEDGIEAFSFVFLVLINSHLLFFLLGFERETISDASHGSIVLRVERFAQCSADRARRCIRPGRRGGASDSKCAERAAELVSMRASRH